MCQQFLNDIPSYTDKGQAFLRSNMKCLQNSLVPHANGLVWMTCDEIKTYAFSQHLVCYTTGSPRFCDIPFSDIARIVITSYKRLINRDGLSQFVGIFKRCGALKLSELFSA